LIITPETYRDIIKVELENQTTTGKPRIGVYDRNKKWLGGTSEYSHQVTAGQNQLYSFKTEANYIYVSNLSGIPGSYRLTIEEQ